MAKKKKKVLVVTHDAGGSEIIAAYVVANRQKYDFRVYTNGPGARIFRRQHIPFHAIQDNRAKIRQLMQKNADADLALIALRGWMTNIEITAQEEAKKRGLKTAVYLEDWINYLHRVSSYPKRGWQKMVPNELWAGDRFALSIARKEFKGTTTKVKLVKNRYFENIAKRARVRTPKTNAILFLSNAIPGQEHLLEQILRKVVSFPKKPKVLIRFHPADERKRYDAVIKKFSKQLRIAKSKEKDLARDLARARTVIGIETVALVAAALSGKKTISIRYSRKVPFPPLPHLTQASAKKAIALIK